MDEQQQMSEDVSVASGSKSKRLSRLPMLRTSKASSTEVVKRKSTSLNTTLTVVRREGGGEPVADITIDSTALRIGCRVCVSDAKLGTLQFYGETQFASGMWCGVVLDDAEGKNDGLVNGVRYFVCPPMHGIFAPPNRVRRIDEPDRNNADGSPLETTFSVSEPEDKKDVTFITTTTPTTAVPVFDGTVPKADVLDTTFAVDYEQPLATGFTSGNPWNLVEDDIDEVDDEEEDDRQSVPGRQGSLDLDESLGILTLSQMPDFTLEPDATLFPAQTPSDDSIQDIVEEEVVGTAPECESATDVTLVFDSSVTFFDSDATPMLNKKFAMNGTKTSTPLTDDVSGVRTGTVLDDIALLDRKQQHQQLINDPNNVLLLSEQLSKAFEAVTSFPEQKIQPDVEQLVYRAEFLVSGKDDDISKRQPAMAASVTSTDTGYQGDGECDVQSDATSTPVEEDAPPMSSSSSAAAAIVVVSAAAAVKPQSQHDAGSDSDFCSDMAASLTESESGGGCDERGRGRGARVIDGRLYYSCKGGNRDSDIIVRDEETRSPEVGASAASSDDTTLVDVDGRDDDVMSTTITVVTAETTPELPPTAAADVEPSAKTTTTTTTTPAKNRKQQSGGSNRKSVKSETPNARKSPKQNVMSKIKAMIEVSTSLIRSNKDSPEVGGAVATAGSVAAAARASRTPKKSRWDAVMSKIAAGQAEDKVKVKKEVTSKVKSNLLPVRTVAKVKSEERLPTTSSSAPKSKSKVAATATLAPPRQPLGSDRSTTKESSSSAKQPRPAGKPVRPTLLSVGGGSSGGGAATSARSPSQNSVFSNGSSATSQVSTRLTAGKASKSVAAAVKRTVPKTTGKLQRSTTSTATSDRFPNKPQKSSSTTCQQPLLLPRPPQQKQPSSSVAANEVVRLEALCEARTKELNYIRMQLRHCAVGFDAFAVLAQYLQLSVSNIPSLASELRATRANLDESRRQCRQLTDELNKARSQQSKSVDEVTERMTAELEQCRRQLRQQQHEECDRMAEAHSKEVESLRGEHGAEIQTIEEEGRKKRESLAAECRRLRSELDRVSDECRPLRSELTSLRSQLSEDTDCRVVVARNRCSMLESEVDSLKAVLDLRLTEMQELRREKLERVNEAEELAAAKERIKKLEAKNEDLQAMIDIRLRNERQLSSDHQVLMENYQKESKASKRLSMENETLLWRLQHMASCSDLSPVNASSEMTTPSKSLPTYLRDQGTATDGGVDMSEWSVLFQDSETPCCNSATRASAMPAPSSEAKQRGVGRRPWSAPVSSRRSQAAEGRENGQRPNVFKSRRSKRRTACRSLDSPFAAAAAMVVVPPDMLDDDGKFAEDLLVANEAFNVLDDVATVANGDEPLNTVAELEQNGLDDDGSAVVVSRTKLETTTTTMVISFRNTLHSIDSSRGSSPVPAVAGTTSASSDLQSSSDASSSRSSPLGCDVDGNNKPLHRSVHRLLDDDDDGGFQSPRVSAGESMMAFDELQASQSHLLLKKALNGIDGSCQQDESSYSSVSLKESLGETPLDGSPLPEVSKPSTPESLVVVAAAQTDATNMDLSWSEEDIPLETEV